MPLAKWISYFIKQMKTTEPSPSGGTVVEQDQTNPAFSEAPVPPKKSKVKAKP
jgi:hypothetical protein